MPIPDGEKNLPLRPCPFCGASGQTYLRKYPNRDVNPSMIMWHDEICPLYHMLECFDEYADEQALADAWNRRWEDA